MPDADRAGRFYSGLFGWRVEAMGGGGIAHTGSMDIGIHGGDRAALLEVFFSIEDLEASTARTKLGGAVDGEATMPATSAVGSSARTTRACGSGSAKPAESEVRRSRGYQGQDALT